MGGEGGEGGVIHHYNNGKSKGGRVAEEPVPLPKGSGVLTRCPLVGRNAQIYSG